jgi:catalase (peroxidase I)
VPFTPGRVDATEAQIDATPFAMLEPKADGFRNYYGGGLSGSPAELLVERANLLPLSVPEMTVLVGGMPALNANEGGSANGVLTNEKLGRRGSSGVSGSHQPLSRDRRRRTEWPGNVWWNEGYLEG